MAKWKQDGLGTVVAASKVDSWLPFPFRDSSFPVLLVITPCASLPLPVCYLFISQCLPISFCFPFPSFHCISSPCLSSAAFVWIKSLLFALWGREAVQAPLALEQRHNKMGCVRPVVFHPSALLPEKRSPLIFILSMFPPHRITNSLIFPTSLTQFLHFAPPAIFCSLYKRYLYSNYYYWGPSITSKKIKHQNCFT